MRQTIKDFVKICSETLPIKEPIYEFGALQVLGQIGFADLRPFFPDKKYIGSDIVQGPGVNVILDMHSINLPDKSVGTALLMDTLEHVEYPRMAMKELYRVLAPNGLLIMSSTTFERIHNYPNDYWRFTPEGFRSLLQEFSSVFISSAGDPRCPDAVVAIAYKHGQVPDLTAELKSWRAKWHRTIQFKDRSLKKKWSRSLRKRWAGIKRLVDWVFHLFS